MEKLLKNNVPAEKQIGQSVHYVGKQGYKILVVGNSITLHGPKAEIGWAGNYGMAASCAENDFVHKLHALCSVRRETQICILQASAFERNYYRDFQFEEYRRAKEFAADCIVMRISENVLPEPEHAETFLREYKRLVDYLNRGNASLVFTTGFWNNGYADPLIKQIAAQSGGELVTLGDLGEDGTMRADGLFAHEGVALHPCDRGMSAIAERIFAVIPKN